MILALGQQQSVAYWLLFSIHIADDLVRTDNCFFVATGITDGSLLRGVRYRGGGAVTHSLVMRSRSGTIRTIEGHHRLTKVEQYSALGPSSQG